MRDRRNSGGGLLAGFLGFFGAWLGMAIGAIVINLLLLAVAVVIVMEILQAYGVI